MRKSKIGVPDAENPEWTDEMFAKAKRGSEVFPDAFLAKVRRYRGKQVAPTKTMVSLRLSRSTVAAFRATGKGWQSRVDELLTKHAPKRVAGTRAATAKHR